MLFAYLILSYSVSVGIVLVVGAAVLLAMVRKTRGSQTRVERRVFEKAVEYKETTRKAYEEGKHREFAQGAYRESQRWYGEANARYRKWSQDKTAEKESLNVTESEAEVENEAEEFELMETKRKLFLLCDKTPRTEAEDAWIEETKKALFSKWHNQKANNTTFQFQKLVFLTHGEIYPSDFRAHYYWKDGVKVHRPSPKPRPPSSRKQRHRDNWPTNKNNRDPVNELAKTILYLSSGEFMATIVVSVLIICAIYGVFMLILIAGLSS